MVSNHPTMFFRVNEPPRPGMTGGEFSQVVLWCVVLVETSIEVVGLADVTTAGRLADEHIDPEWIG